MILLWIMIGALIGIALSALLYGSSDTLYKEISDLRSKNHELVNKLREVNKQLLYYKAIVQKFEDLMRE